MGPKRDNRGRAIVRRRGRSVFLLLCCLAFFPLPEPSLSLAASGKAQKPGELLAFGDAAIVKGNRALAKKMAVTQALMKGVEDYVVNLLGSQGAVSHFERVIEEIIPAVREEIENFHILAEQQIGDRYKVLLRLRVNGSIIRERLRSAGLLLTETSPVKVLFLVSEIREGKASYWWKDPEGSRSLSPVELALHTVFQNRGLSPINRTLSPPGADQAGGLTSADLQDEDILKWGRLFSADFVIYGQCHISGNKEISLTLRVLNVCQGVQVCREFTGEQIEEGDRESFVTALEGVVNPLAAALCSCIRGVADSDREKPYPLTVTLAGMRMPKQFWRFSSFLSHDVMGVTSVIPSRIRDNTMSATVGFRGDQNTFISRVLNHPNRPFPLRINQLQAGMIVFDLE